MASELKNNEEGMAEILAANESLLRITDTYKHMFEEPAETPGSTTNGTSTETTVNSSASAVTLTTTSTTSAPPTASGGGANSISSAAGSSDVLIDLADLDFGPPPSGYTGSSSGQDGNLSSFLDDQGLLGV